MWQVTGDMWYVTCDIWHIVWDEHAPKISGMDSVWNIFELKDQSVSHLIN